ncbi:MAG: tRNA (N(6)-L-threonylcarbamoyladenosine(37)-C(2))-methylthiotransferase MtaB [Candidatus Acidiferrales bacterium]
MLRFSIENFGCRATDADAAVLRHALVAGGLALTREHSQADVVVLNSCTVTASADAQAREAVRRIHRMNPAARIVVTGCYAQRAPEELAQIEGVSCVVGNAHFTQIPGAIRELTETCAMAAATSPSVRPDSRNDFVSIASLDGDAMSLARGPAKILTGDIFAQATVQLAPTAGMASDRTRPILKIQDGCNNRCAYCVIPFVRGRSRSLAPDSVLEEVRNLIASGAKEIVLSGINLGAYGRDLAPRVSLVDIARRILAETALERLRFSSIEPQDITEEFVALTASSDRVAPHFHVPLQSGSNAILRTMHRWYRAEHYAERIRLIRAYLPGAAIGADVIAGFPGEANEEFAQTAEFIERLPFSYLHVFSFSERPGTEAANLGGVVRGSVIRERARKLRAMSQQKAVEFRASQAGRRLRALTLARGSDNWTEALTGNYLKVRVAGRRPANEWCEAVVAADPNEVDI